MPQHSLLKDHDEPTGLRIEVIDRTPELLPHWEVSWYMRRLDGDWTLYTTIGLVGIEVDFLDTIMRETTTAWAYGTRGDLLRAITRLHRAAKAHRRAHEYAD